MHRFAKKQMSESAHNMIKGRVAETIVQELFLSNNYLVFHYGMERTLPEILPTIRKSLDEVSRAIKSQPDFVIQDRFTGELMYLEVKFRCNGRFDIDDLPNLYPYKNAHFVIVSPSNIQAIHYSDLAKGYRINNCADRKLKDYPFFKLDKNSVQQFEKYIHEFFGNTNNSTE